MTIAYQVYEREKGQHRAGHLSFRIGDYESQLTIDPTQYMAKALPMALEAGAQPGEEALGKAMELCLAMAKKAMNRKIGKLRRGLQPGGINLSKPDFQKGGIEGFTAADLAELDRGEGNAIERFLNRGWLKGLKKSEREEVAAYREKQRAFDNEADWKERRKALVERCQRRIQEEESKLNGLTKIPGEVPAEFEGRQEKINHFLRGFRQELAGYQGPLAATHGFQYAYTQYLTAAVNLATDDIRIWPIMNATTLDTVRDGVDTFSDTTVDEFDGSGYVAGGLALDSQVVAVDDANDRAEFDAADEVMTALGAGTRPMQGVALGKFLTSTALSLPLHWIQFASDKTPDGSDFTLVFNAEGILQAVDG